MMNRSNEASMLKPLVTMTCKGFGTVPSAQFNSQGLDQTVCMVFRQFSTVPNAGFMSPGQYYQVTDILTIMRFEPKSEF